MAIPWEPCLAGTLGPCIILIIPSAFRDAMLWADGIFIVQLILNIKKPCTVKYRVLILPIIRKITASSVFKPFSGTFVTYAFYTKRFFIMDTGLHFNHFRLMLCKPNLKRLPFGSVWVAHISFAHTRISACIISQYVIKITI